MLHLMHANGGLRLARDGQLVPPEEESGKYNPCWAVAPIELHGPNDYFQGKPGIMCSRPGKNHIGPHRGFRSPMELVEWD